MITTRRTSGPMFRAEVEADPRFRAGYGLGAGRMSYGAGYGDYGDVVTLRGRGRSLGEVIRWAPLGPGGDPQMSLQGLGEVIRWAPLGPGGDPQMSLQGRRLRGFPATMAEVDWAQVALGAVLGIGGLMIAKKQKWIR